MDFNNKKIQENINSILGEPADHVLHAVVPFDLGYDAGGRADVYIYQKHLENCIVYITGDLIGKKQGNSDAGNYEFMICHSNENTWGPNLINTLAYYTLTSSINSGETMDLGPFAEEENTIKAIIFDKYSEFKIRFQKYGLMLIIGITEDELEWAKKNGGKELIKELKEKKTYPITDLKRKSIF